MKGMSVLISGAGIAGPALAFWLDRHGLIPTLVERAPVPRDGGYIIDFWGLGYDIAERMGLLPAVLRAGYDIVEVRLVDERGRRVGGFDVNVFREATRGRYTSLPRGALSAILRRSIEGRVDTIFGDSIIAIEPEGDASIVRFHRGQPRRFDVVVGADGLHSRVRELAFGPESRFEVFLRYTVAAFEVSGYQPREEDIYVGYAVAGCQIARFSLRADRTMFLVVIADDDLPSLDPRDREAERRYLRTRLAGIGWEVPQILSALERCDDLYFDQVSQIRLDRWSQSHAVLVGDAAYAPSLLAGQGAALAMIGAYVLAGELGRATTREDAFASYERLLQPFMRDKQDAAVRFAASFAPRTQVGIWIRNHVTKVFALPGIAKLAFGPGLVDKLQLPDY